MTVSRAQTSRHHDRDAGATPRRLAGADWYHAPSVGSALAATRTSHPQRGRAIVAAPLPDAPSESPNMANVIDELNREQLRADVPQFGPGDTVRVQVKVTEGTRERLQAFEGVCMRYVGGSVLTRFTVRKISSGIGVERTFLLHSPKIDRIEVMRRGKIRRAQLYYLRGLTGKAARIKELRRR